MEQAIPSAVQPVVRSATLPLKRPWRDYSGRVSLLKSTVFIGLFVPGAITAFNLATHNLGAQPLNEALREVGDWGLRFLFLTLLVTPLSRLLYWPRLNLVRRMLGVTSFAYIASHLTLYSTDQMFNWTKIASEIVLRYYLTIGFVALLGLFALAATSTDAMVRRMGARNWQRLHRIVYVIAMLGVIHYFLQTKLEEWLPMIMLGLYLWLMGYRLIASRIRGRVPPLWSVALLSLASGALTAAFEIAYFAVKMHVPVARIFPAEISLMAGVRPAYVVLAITFGVTLAASVAHLIKHRRPSRVAVTGIP
jgi:methionine sulfoxide reductase heme-binding subunit